MSIETIVNTEPQIIVDAAEALYNTAYSYVTQVIAIASLVATMLGSKSGNKYIAWFKRLINLFAANWGRAKNLEELEQNPVKTVNNTKFNTLYQ